MMGYKPELVAKWFVESSSKTDFISTCYIKHNMTDEAANDYWNLCSAVVAASTAKTSGAPAEQTGNTGSNPFCGSCKEKDCVVSTDGTCAMIRVYLAAKRLASA